MPVRAPTILEPQWYLNNEVRQGKKGITNYYPRLLGRQGKQFDVLPTPFESQNSICNSQIPISKTQLREIMFLFCSFLLIFFCSALNSKSVGS
ncbi:MAG: hypothetical protein EZS28_044874 [Streblomastix strix]|uniref:Uncharacterized protein n=1 Tax=Streblomastix strix TaxID=222440 RepID=A0A5J4TMQ8_9EUKA|nr:MAG: hypothetical protein EZS28_044874 [Streblomastix strix]